MTIHPTLTEIDLCRRYRDYQPGPPQLWITPLADAWTQQCDREQRGLRLYVLREIGAEWLAAEVCYGLLVWGRTHIHWGDAAKALGERLDYGIAQCGEIHALNGREFFALFRQGRRGWYAARSNEDARVEVERCGSFRRGLFAMAAWLARCAPCQQIVIAAFEREELPQKRRAKVAGEYSPSGGSGEPEPVDTRIGRDGE